jgi:hypothetical protein
MNNELKSSVHVPIIMTFDLREREISLDICYLFMHGEEDLLNIFDTNLWLSSTILLRDRRTWSWILTLRYTLLWATTLGIPNTCFLVCQLLLERRCYNVALLSQRRELPSSQLCGPTPRIRMIDDKPGIVVRCGYSLITIELICSSIYIVRHWI